MGKSGRRGNRPTQNGGKDPREYVNTSPEFSHKHQNSKHTQQHSHKDETFLCIRLSYLQA